MVLVDTWVIPNVTCAGALVGLHMELGSWDGACSHGTCPVVYGSGKLGL
jgi:hypothetical protein